MNKADSQKDHRGELDERYIPPGKPLKGLQDTCSSCRRAVLRDKGLQEIGKCKDNL